MSKLYKDNDFINIPQEALQDVSSVSVEDLSVTIDKDIIALEKQHNAYNSVTNITFSDDFKDFSFVTSESAPLFNEYLNMLKSNFGLNTNPYMALESNLDNKVDQSSYHIALEGVVGSMWQGIKNLFSKIGNAMKEFFKRHFTKLGRTKARLQSLIKSLNKTDKDLQELNLEKIPGSIVRAFPFKGNVGDTQVKESVKLSTDIVKALNKINSVAEATAKKNVIEPNFVAKLKSIKDKYEASSEKLDKTPEAWIGGKLVKSETHKRRKQAEGENASISDELNKQKKQLDDNVEDKDEIDLDDEVQGLIEARKEVGEFFVEVTKSFESLKDRKMPGGKFIKSVSVTIGDENSSEPPKIEIETDDDKDKPDTCSLTSRSGCISLCEDTLKSIEEVEGLVNKYSKVSDVVDKNVNTVDKLIKDLDRMSEGASAQKYKKLLQNQVKARLNLMRSFFVEYNKINKNLLGYTVDIGSGVVVYVQESMKRFG